MKSVIHKVTVSGAAGVFVGLGFKPALVRVLNTNDRKEILFADGDTANAFGVAIDANGVKTVGIAGTGITVVEGGTTFVDAAGKNPGEAGYVKTETVKEEGIQIGATFAGDTQVLIVEAYEPTMAK